MRPGHDLGVAVGVTAAFVGVAAAFVGVAAPAAGDAAAFVGVAVTAAFVGVGVAFAALVHATESNKDATNNTAKPTSPMTSHVFLFDMFLLLSTKFRILLYHGQLFGIHHLPSVLSPSWLVSLKSSRSNKPRRLCVGA